MALLKVYNGASWDTAVGKVYDGAAWEDKMNFYNGSAQVELYPTGITMTIYHFSPLTTWTTYWGGTSSYAGWGYDGGNDYYGHGTNQGAMTPNTYTDGSPTTRTISGLYWSQSNYLIFSLDTTSVPNTDTTFVSIDVDGNNYTRSSATYVASLNGASHWYWAEATRPFPASGDVPIVVNL